MRELANRYSISFRQAYRYLEQAQHLRQPIPVNEGKVACTVQLSKKLVQQIRLYAHRSGLSLSELVGQALMAVLRRRRGRG
jgi:predicted DNA-binding transcriptional regulator YafY